MKAKLNEQDKAAIIDTGSSGVVVSETCFRRLNLSQDCKVEFIIKSDTETSKRTKKVLKDIKIRVGESNVVVLIIVLEGLHFDVLL